MESLTRAKASPAAKRAGNDEKKLERFITDERMLLVRDYCIRLKLNDIDTAAKWYQAIGIHPYNATAYTSGRSGFTKQQMQAVGQLFGISMDFLYGFSDTMLRDASVAYTSADLIESMRTSLALLEMDLRLKANAGAALRDFKQGNTSGNTSLKKPPKTQKTKT